MPRPKPIPLIGPRDLALAVVLLCGFLLLKVPWPRYTEGTPLEVDAFRPSTLRAATSSKVARRCCDTAATIAYVLGLAPPDSRIAKPVIEAFSTHPHSKR